MLFLVFVSMVCGRLFGGMKDAMWMGYGCNERDATDFLIEQKTVMSMTCVCNERGRSRQAAKDSNVDGLWLQWTWCKGLEKLCV